MHSNGVYSGCNHIEPLFTLCSNVFFALSAAAVYLNLFLIAHYTLDIACPDLAGVQTEFIYDKNNISQEVVEPCNFIIFVGTTSSNLKSIEFKILLKKH